MKPPKSLTPNEPTTRWRNKKTGTIYTSLVKELGGLATVTTEAGSKYVVKMSNLEEF